MNIVAAEPAFERIFFHDIGNAIFSKRECGRTGIEIDLLLRRPASALEARTTEMTAQSHEKAEAMAAAQRCGSLAVIFAVLARCSWLLFAAAAGQKARFSAAKASLPAVSFRDLQRYQRRSRVARQRRIPQARAKACLKARQTRCCAFIASSTAGTMPKNAWIMPGNSRYSTGTPARRNPSA
jgi:hypothetical protein